MTTGGHDEGHSHSTLQIDAERPRCIIEDSGPGVDEHLPHLLDNSFTSKESGMGLGLPVVQSIIEAPHGYIRADNGRLSERQDFSLSYQRVHLWVVDGSDLGVVALCCSEAFRSYTNRCDGAY